jgi:DNA-binding NarL/FixJ family response regulator
VQQIRALVADEHALVRRGICVLLEKLPELQIVGEAGDGYDALRLIKQHQPNLALIGGALSKLNGFEVTARASQECPDVNVIILSAHADETYLSRAFSCGAAGYLTMAASVTELEFAVKAVANGETHICSSVRKLLLDFVRFRAGNETFARLTARQRQVLKLIADGNSTKQIALVLNISVKTVETHRMLLTDRLDIHDTAGLVRYAIKAGLIRLED